MKVQKKLLIIIPARKGSSEVKNKNIRNYKQHPLIAYAIEAAKKLPEKDKEIFLSTDSKKIVDIAKKYFLFDKKIELRPKKISKKLSRDIDFVNHALKYYKKKKILFKYCLILRPTNPVRRISTLKKAYSIMQKNLSISSLKSISVSEKSLFKMWTKNKRNIIKNPAKLKKIKDSFNAPRQILPSSYIQTGTIEFLRINFNQKISSFSGNKIYGLVIDEYESLDIDKSRDLKNFFLLKHFILPKKI